MFNLPILSISDVKYLVITSLFKHSEKAESLKKLSEIKVYSCKFDAMLRISKIETDYD